PPRWLWLSSALTTSSCSLGITGARPGARERPVADEQLGQLGLVGRGRAAGHQILTLLRLGERDHVAEAVRAGHQHRQAIDAERDPAVRRRAVLEGVEQEAELGAG